MSRESAFAKSRRLLSEGRVSVLAVQPHLVFADVRGDSAAVYRVTFVRGLDWKCGCAARGVCSHILAVQLCVLVEDENHTPPEVGDPVTAITERRGRGS